MEHSFGNKTSDGPLFNRERSFDTNMVIILAALLCALICALGLNSIARCAIRCGQRFSRRRSAATGLKKRELSRIPVAAYTCSGGDPAGTSTECAICLGEFADGDKIRVLPKCNHVFHVWCIDKWLASRSSCPNCRHSVLELDEESSAGSGRPESAPEDGVVVVVEAGGR